jgi:electron transfer flavoprotein alpha/beta subunit
LDASFKCSSIGKIVGGLPYDLILCGDRSEDEGGGYLVPFLANFLGCPQATKVVKIEFDPEQHVATVWRQLERGWREEIECGLPAVFGVERSAHEPRYVSVFSREAALTKPVERLEAGISGTGEQLGASLQVVEVTPPRPRTKKTFVPDSSLPPEERFQLLLSGGVAPKKNSDFIEGEPGQVAREVVDFLKNEGFIYPSGPNNSSGT